MCPTMQPKTLQRQCHGQITAGQGPCKVCYSMPKAGIVSNEVKQSHMCRCPGLGIGEKMRQFRPAAALPVQL